MKNNFIAATLLLTVISSLLSLHSNAQTPNFIWAKGAGGTYDDNGRNVTVDASGNTYVTGMFRSPTITFGATTLTNIDNSGTSNDMFIVKYDTAGNVLWAKSAGGNTYDQAISVAVDANGNVYVTGNFKSATINFGSTTLTNTDASSTDIFIAKYDGSGNALWAKSAGGNNNDEAISIATDLNGNIYVAGGYQSASITFGTTTLTNSESTGGTNDVYIAKYDASGNVLWAKSAVGGNVDDDEATSITVDANGNVYVVGKFFSPTLTFGTNTLTNATNTNNYYDMFIVKYDPSGNVLWAKSAGGTTSEYAFSVAVDANGNAYVAGYFKSPSITFGTTTLTNASNSGSYADIFITKYDASGNVLWAKSAGGTSNDKAHSVTLDANSNLYITGSFYSPSLIFGASTLTNTNNDFDIFVAKYDVSGNSLWAKNAGGNFDDEAYSITLDANSNIYVSGYFKSSSIGFGSTTLTNTGGAGAVFLVKLDNPATTYTISASASSNNLGSVSGGGNYNSGATATVSASANSGYVFSNWTENGNPVSTNSTYTFTVTGSRTLVANFVLLTGILNIEENNFINIYPNPTSGTINIQLKQAEKTQIKIIDILGKCVYESNLASSSVQIDLSSQMNGVYVLQLENEKGTIYKKLIIQK